jgi:DNA anti-recombination protein RmuC
LAVSKELCDERFSRVSDNFDFIKEKLEDMSKKLDTTIDEAKKERQTNSKKIAKLEMQPNQKEAESSRSIKSKLINFAAQGTVGAIIALFTWYLSTLGA